MYTCPVECDQSIGAKVDGAGYAVTCLLLAWDQPQVFCHLLLACLGAYSGMKLPTDSTGEVGEVLLDVEAVHYAPQEKCIGCT